MATLSSTAVGGTSGADVGAQSQHDLIASNRVEGTPVFNRQGERLGEVYNFMVGKRSGKVAYANLSFGGLLGVGGSYHPLPWEVLTYDTGRGGYVVDLSKDQLTNAPSHRTEEDAFADPGYGRRVSDYYKTSYGY